MHVEEWNDSKPQDLGRVTAGLGSFQTPSDSIHYCVWGEFSAGILDPHVARKAGPISALLTLLQWPWWFAGSPLDAVRLNG